MRKNLSLYIHIPFCESKCKYCNFVSKVGTEAEKREYVAALMREIEIQGKKYNPHFAIYSIYIGGGTPSCLDDGEILKILQHCYKHFTVRNEAEITIELNPNSVTDNKIREFILAGVNRFSIGLQCTNGKVLRSMGRAHTVGDFDAVVSRIRGKGITNISADIMIGYPGQSMIDIKDTVNHLVRLNVPHISSYMLSVEDNTPLQVMVDRKLTYLPTEKTVVNMYLLANRLLSEKGYERYEISNFAKPGFESRHNMIYWNGGDYLGLGVSAHSYIDGVRFSNTEDSTLYNEYLMTRKKVPIITVQELSEQEKKEEFIMLSLRTGRGIDTNLYMEKFGEDFLGKNADKLKEYIQMGLIKLTANNFIKCTTSGFLVLNKLILELS